MDVDNSEQSSQKDELDIGSLLVEARDNAGLTTEDIATALNLNLEVIDKIEQNIFRQESPIAFIRGYVKSYATRVGLDSQSILMAFDKITGAESPSLKRVDSISSFGKKSREFNSNSSLFKIISILIVLLFVTFAGWQIWVRFVAPTFSNNDSQAESSASNSIDLSLNLTEESNQVSNEGAIPLANINTEQIDSDKTQTIEPAIEDSQDLDENRTSNSVKAVALSSVTFDFIADCWVKITDASGEVLAVGVKRDGKHMPVKGISPISVILGDPSAVRIRFEDQNYDLESYPAGRRVEFVLE